MKEDAVRLPLAENEQALLESFAAAFGEAVQVVDIQFADGARVADVRVEGNELALPASSSGKSIDSISIPHEQGVQTRSKGYAAKIDRRNKQMSMAPTMMMRLLASSRGPDVASGRAQADLAATAVAAPADCGLLSAKPHRTVTVTTDDRQIRVFISSTFRDMMRERDLLVKVVLPALRRKCAKRFVNFTEVDLRWGISKEQAAEGQVLPLCLAEIERSRPYFIGLLGERYGWIPDVVRPEVVEREPWLQEHLHARTSVTELEILHGVLRNPKMAGHAYFYFRDPAYVNEPSLSDAERREMAERNIPVDVEKHGEAEASRRTQARKAKLEALKQRIRDSGLPLVESYANPDALAEIVRKQFDELVDRLYPEVQTPSPLAQERMAHDAHARSKLLGCIDRPAHMKALTEFVDRGDGCGKGLVMTGESGGGKTALLAGWVRDRARTNPNDWLFQHYFGATPASATPEGFLSRLMGELKERFGVADEIPHDPDKLRDALPAWLMQTESKGRIILILDGLNQVEGGEPDRRLRFLPRSFPAHVTVLSSALPGPATEALRERGWTEYQLSHATEAEADAMAAEYLRRIGRFVDTDGLPIETPLRRQIVAAPGSRNPLFLRTVLEELRQFGNFETLPARVAHYLEAPDPKELFLRVIGRWQEDFDNRDVEGRGRDLTRRALTHLWAARQGLSESEWRDLLGGMPLATRNLTPSASSPLPRALWTPLFLAIEPHLTQRNGLFAFGHEFLRQAAEQTWLATLEAQCAAHLALADYFEGHPTQAEMTARKAAEWPFQIHAAQSWTRLESCLTDLLLFHALYNDNTKWELIRYWIPLRDNGSDVARAYRAAYDRFVEVTRHGSHPPQNESAGHALAHELGSFLLESGSYSVAEQMLRLAHESRKRSLGEHHADTLTTAHSLAMTLQRLGRSDEAEPLFRQILLVRDRLGVCDKSTLATVSALGVLLHGKGRFSDAQALHRRSADMATALFGRDHPVTCMSLDNYGNCLARMGRRAEAEECYRRAHEGLERHLGSDHPDTLTALNNSLALSIQTGHTEGLSALADKLVRSSKGAQGVHHPDTITTLDNVATLLSRTGDLANAEVLRRQALEAAERVLGDEHRETLIIRMNLATLMSRQGRTKQAIALAQRELCRVERVFGPRDPYTINCIEDLALRMEEDGRLAEAYALYRDALARSRSARSKTDPDHQNLVSNYADLLRKMGLD